MITDRARRSTVLARLVVVLLVVVLLLVDEEVYGAFLKPFFEGGSPGGSSG